MRPGRSVTSIGRRAGKRAPMDWRAAGDGPHFERAGGRVECRAARRACRSRSERIAASTIAVVSAAVTRPTGVFISGSSSGDADSSRVRRLMQADTRDRRERHRHGGLIDSTVSRHNEAERQRAERQRGRDGAVSPGRRNGRTAIRSRRAGRPHHWSKSLKTRTESPAVTRISATVAGKLRRFGQPKTAKSRQRLTLCPL